MVLGCNKSALLPHLYQLVVSPYECVFLLPVDRLIEVANLVADLGLVPAEDVVDDVFDIGFSVSSFDWQADFNRYRLEKFYNRNHSRSNVHVSDIGSLFE